MSTTSSIVAALLATTLVACKPSPRYTINAAPPQPQSTPQYSFYEASDPRNGQHVTIRQDNSKGALSFLSVYKGRHGNWLTWEGFINLSDAVYMDKEMTRQDATNSGPMTIK